MSASILSPSINDLGQTFMPADDGWTSVTNTAAASAVSASQVGRPQFSAIDIILMLWRGKLIMLGVALPFVLLAVLFSLTLKKEFVATSRIQVTAGAERVFDPIVGNAQAQVLSQEEITESEIELLQTREIFDRVILALGLEVIYPDIYDEFQKASPAERPLIYEKAIEAMQKNFSVGASPKNPVIRTSFAADDPILAANVLNTLIRAYLDYRADIFTKDNDRFFAAQRVVASDKLEESDKSIERFLLDHRIGDFDAEKTSVAALFASVTDELFKVQAQKSEVDGRLAATNVQLSMTEPMIDLNRETNHGQQLLDLRIERAALAATYQPDTPRMQALDRQISETEAVIATAGSDAGRIQRGPNLVYQELETRQTQLEADSQALRERFEALTTQKQQIERRQLELTRLEPNYQELLRDRAILENQVRSLSVREEEERLKRNAAREDVENIQILEAARPPPRGQSSRRLIIAAGAVLGLGTGFLFALIWVFTRTTLPTASCFARTTGLPVLASVRAEPS